MTNTPIRVAVFYGGTSGEHAVSCMTAASVFEAIDRSAFEVIPIGITRDGTWVRGSFDPAPTTVPAGQHAVPEGMPLAIRPDTGEIYDEDGSLGVPDVVFPLLHGPFGEDGTIQGLFEIAGIRYVGAGVFASAAAMDKHYTKIILKDAGLPVVDWVLVTTTEWENNRAELLARAAGLDFPLFVKPSRAGSSLGVSKVSDPRELTDAIELARTQDPRVLIESGAPGREVECAVLGGRGTGPSRASTVGEIVLAGGDAEFYDYKSKYVETDGLKLEIPANIPEEDVEKIRGMAVRAFDVLACEGMARVDFFYDDGSLVINEINTIPGFTPYSMYPLLWQASGLTYGELLAELITLAADRELGLR